MYDMICCTGRSTPQVLVFYIRRVLALYCVRSMFISLFLVSLFATSARSVTKTRSQHNKIPIYTNARPCCFAVLYKSDRPHLIINYASITKQLNICLHTFYCIASSPAIHIWCGIVVWVNKQPHRQYKRKAILTQSNTTILLHKHTPCVLRTYTHKNTFKSATEQLYIYILATHVVYLPILKSHLNLLTWLLPINSSTVLPKKGTPCVRALSQWFTGGCKPFMYYGN